MWAQRTFWLPGSWVVVSSAIVPSSREGRDLAGGGVPRSKRLGSTIHLQINNLYVVLLSYNRINRCSVEEKKSGIR